MGKKQPLSIIPRLQSIRDEVIRDRTARLKDIQHLEWRIGTSVWERLKTEYELSTVPTDLMILEYSYSGAILGYLVRIIKDSDPGYISLEPLPPGVRQFIIENPAWGANEIA